MPMYEFKNKHSEHMYEIERIRKEIIDRILEKCIISIQIN